MSKILEKLSKEDLLDLVRKYRNEYFKYLELYNSKSFDIGCVATFRYNGENTNGIIKQIFKTENYTICYIQYNGLLLPINPKDILYIE